ncbi:MAG: hypothetical protein EOP24_32725 [Hyphomicrobiales bacterium]|nr:MAG: hypothetical protein EOP24_32725 [Hyphomicrobiales bacterium]
MSDNSPFGFGRFVPGFDFLQSLSKGSAAGMPAMSNWVAPTVSVEELDKRIEELKAVQFWLEQNSRALTATVQALEVQKMTLATLKGMNVAMGDLAEAFTGKAGAPEPGAPAAGSSFKPAAAASAPASAPSFAAPEPQTAASHGAGPDDEPAPAAAPGVIDPMQWWSALGAQFQQIAANAMTDVGHTSALDTTREMAAEAMKTATGMASQFAAQATRTAPAARKSGKSSGTPGTGAKAEKAKAAGASRKRTTAGSSKSAARPAATASAPRSKKPAAPPASAKKAAAPRAGGARRTGG